MNLGFIGMGNMAEAIVKGIIQKGGIPAGNVYAFDPDTKKLRKMAEELGFNPCKSNEDLVDACDMVLVAVKPYLVEKILAPLEDKLKGKALLSVAVGWDYDRYEKILPAETRHLFIMPNTPALVGEGVLLFEEKNSLLPQELEEVKRLFALVGMVETLPSELMGIGGVVSSCSPAFIAMVIEAMADAGVMYGLSRPLAYRLASQAVAGTGKMALETGRHPGQLKDMVCSPKGTTIHGVASLEKSGLRDAFITAIRTVCDL